MVDWTSQLKEHKQNNPTDNKIEWQEKKESSAIIDPPGTNWGELLEQEKSSTVNKQSTGAGGSFETPELEWNEVYTKSIENLPNSAIKAGKGIWDAITSPRQTASSFYDIARSIVEYAVPGGQTGEKTLDTLAEMIENRYGNLKNFKDTLAYDPFGAILDMQSLMMGGGGALKGTKVGNVLTKTAAATDPISLVGTALKSPVLVTKIPGINKATRIAIQDMYSKAVSFNPKLGFKKRRTISQTALDIGNEIMPTAKGLDRLHAKLEFWNKRISSLVEGVKGEIPISKLKVGLDDLYKEMLLNTTNTTKAKLAIKRTQKRFTEMEQIGPTREPMMIQKMKQEIYRDMKSYYEQIKNSSFDVKIAKKIAKNARISLEEIIPEIKNMNRQEGELLALWDAIENKANVISLKDLYGVGSNYFKVGLGGAAGGIVGGQKGMVIGSGMAALATVYNTPLVKAKLAIVLNKLRAKGIVIKPTRTAIELGLFQTTRDFKETPQKMNIEWQKKKPRVTVKVNEKDKMKSTIETLKKENRSLEDIYRHTINKDLSFDAMEEFK